jgi:hypothetical protein
MRRVSILLPALGFLAWGILPANSQTGHTHEGDVGAFYQSWMIPGSRGHSCCNLTHCRPVLDMRESVAHPEIGRWEVLVSNGSSQQFWYPVPDKIWEDRWPDARQSPDGKPHVCVINGNVVCAVRTPGL